MTGATYWAWWGGALLLSFVAVAHLWLAGHLLAVSGILDRILRWRADEEDRTSEVTLADGGLNQALLDATAAQFGPAAAAALEADVMPDNPDSPAHSMNVRMPISAASLFVAFLVLGGALSAWTSVGFALDWSLGPAFEELVTSRGLRLALPGVGGLLVGFGAKMAGGCTSSHGLVGCARLQTSSLLSTTGFFAGGIVASWLIGVIG